MSKFEIISKEEKLPSVLGTLGFNNKNSFSSRVARERLGCKEESGNRKEMIRLICKKIIDQEDFSAEEYGEIRSLVEKELHDIEKTIKDAQLLEDENSVNREKKVPDAWAGKVSKVNEDLLRSDHSF